MDTAKEHGICGPCLRLWISGQQGGTIAFGQAVFEIDFWIGTFNMDAGGGDGVFEPLFIVDDPGRDLGDGGADTV